MNKPGNRKAVASSVSMCKYVKSPMSSFCPQHTRKHFKGGCLCYLYNRSYCTIQLVRISSWCPLEIYDLCFKYLKKNNM